VRPFVMREIVLAEEKEMKNVWKKSNNRVTVTQFLCDTVDEMIEEAKNDWLEMQEGELPEGTDPPLPLIRLRVEYTAPEGNFEIENPQRFSNRFVGKVANVNDVIQFHRKKTTATRRTQNGDIVSTITDEALLEAYGGDIDNIKVEALVREFLDKATMEVLPSNGLGDAVGQYVEKDDRHALESFVDDSLKSHLEKIRGMDDLNEETLADLVQEHQSYLEEQFAKGLIKTRRVC
jgi:double-strand break repair protein MRE11